MFFLLACCARSVGRKNSYEIESSLSFNMAKKSSADKDDWDFCIRAMKFDLCEEDPDITSATDFFNQTNGLGSPEYYLLKRRKEQEEKENFQSKNRRVALGCRPIWENNPEATKQNDPSLLKPCSPSTSKKDREALKRRFSDIGPIALPEHQNTRRVSAVGDKPPIRTRSSSVIRQPETKQPLKKSSTSTNRPVKTNSVSAVVKLPVVKSPTSKPKRAPVISEPASPVVSQPSLGLDKPTQSTSHVEQPKGKRLSGITKPTPVVRAAAVVLPKRAATTAKQTVIRQPAVLPDHPENSVTGPMTRSREAARRRLSFMQPTEASMRRSIHYHGKQPSSNGDKQEK